MNNLLDGVISDGARKVAGRIMSLFRFKNMCKNDWGLDQGGNCKKISKSQSWKLKFCFVVQWTKWLNVVISYKLLENNDTDWVSGALQVVLNTKLQQCDGTNPVAKCPALLASAPNMQGKAMGYKSISMMEVKPASCLPLISLLPPLPLTLAAGGRQWRTAQSPCPSDTRTGSSRTATAATESKWRSRNTWRRSSGKGIDRELETKDAGWHICSILPSRPEKQKQTTKLKCVPPQMKSF